MVPITFRVERADTPTARGVVVSATLVDSEGKLVPFGGHLLVDRMVKGPHWVVLRGQFDLMRAKWRERTGASGDFIDVMEALARQIIAVKIGEE